MKNKKFKLDDIIKLIMVLGFGYYYFFTQDTHQMAGAGLLVIILMLLERGE